MTEKKTLKQILEKHIEAQMFDFPEDTKTFINAVARNGVKEWLQQKSMKLKYLTEKETKMPKEMVNLQIVLGLQSCETKGDVCELLNDIRIDERKRLLEELK